MQLKFNNKICGAHLGVVNVAKRCYHMRMGSDLYALSALAKELNLQLKGARIDKIQQPEADELRFFVRAQGKNLCLVISCNAAAPRIHLTSSRKPSPQAAPNLCMLLRKYLSNAAIDEIGVFNADRIIYLRFNARTEMRDEATYFMFVEIMNRYSNIVFTDAQHVILDAVKHLPLEEAREHVVMRGIHYSPVTQPKTSYLNVCNGILSAFCGGDLHKYILANISGFSGATVTELLFRAGLANQTERLSDAQSKKLKETFAAFARCEDFAPCMIGGEVYPNPYRSLAAADMSNVTRFESMSEAYDALYTAGDREIRNRARLKTLSTQAKRLRAKVEKNIAIDLERLSECENMDKYRLYGELVVNNIYKIKQGDEVLHCLDYYSSQEVDIPLDARLSPSKNSTAYYAKYNKLKRTKEFTQKKLVADRELLSYVRSIEEEISALPYDAGTQSIEEELSSLGGIKRKASKGKVRKKVAEPPYIYRVDGFDIYKGKNNLQNDELTFKIASSNDIWLHIKNGHGAHTVIITEGRPVPDKVLKIAGEIAASNMQASCDVDYTERRNVKRKPMGHPGQVIYVNFRTMLSTPDAHEEFLIKK